MRTSTPFPQDTWTYGAAGAPLRRVCAVPKVHKCHIPELEDFRCPVTESLWGSRVKRTQGWSANGPDGSCGGMVSRRNLKGGAGRARAKEGSTNSLQGGPRVLAGGARRGIEH